MAKSDTRDNFEIVTEALRVFGGSQKSSGDSRFICCPFPEHGGTDHTPSLGIYMRVDGKLPFSTFHCFGCGTKGTWNRLAAVIGAPMIKEWQKSAVVSEAIVTPEIEQQLLGESGMTFKSVLKIMGCEEAQRWPKHLQWRGLDGKLIYAVGGHIVEDSRNDGIGLLFPIKIGGKVRGGVRAVFEKRGKQLGYINMKGDSWAKDFGLFPFMYAQKIITDHDYNFCVLVEGPRDALRLCSLGIPAIAILGATSMSKTKAQFITALGIDTVYAITDNDGGGDTCWKTIRTFVKRDSVELRRLKLPKELDKRGKLIKMDPANAPIEIVKRIIDVLVARNGFVPPKHIKYDSI